MIKISRRITDEITCLKKHVHDVGKIYFVSTCNGLKPLLSGRMYQSE